MRTYGGVAPCRADAGCSERMDAMLIKGFDAARTSIRNLKGPPATPKVRRRRNVRPRRSS